MRALVFDGQTRSALAVTRSLGRAGVDVTVAAATRRSLAGSSRHARACLVWPDPVADPDGFADAMANEAGRWRGDLWIPMTDASLAVVSATRERLEPVVLPFPPSATLDLAWDKSRLLDSAAAAGVACPATYRPDSVEAVRELAPRLDYPIVLKPRLSRWRTAGGFRTGEVSYVRSAAALPDAWLEQHGRVPLPLIQERIPGHGMGVFILADHGRILARFAHRRLREKPPTGGVSVLREAIDVPDVVRGPAERLVEALGWHGVCMIEFRVDARDGTPYLMEINPRFWGSLQLAIDAGVDFPQLLYRLARGETLPAVTDYRRGVRCRWWLGDLDHLLIRLLRRPRQSELPPGSPGIAGALLDFLNPWAGRLEVMRPEDPGPGLFELGDYVRKLLGGRDRTASVHPAAPSDERSSGAPGADAPNASAATTRNGEPRARASSG